MTSDKENLPAKEASLSRSRDESLPKKGVEHLPRKSPIETVGLNDWAMKTVPLNEVSHLTPLVTVLCAVLVAEGKPMTVSELTRKALQRVPIAKAPMGPEGVVRLLAQKIAGLTLISPA